MTTPDIRVRAMQLALETHSLGPDNGLLTTAMDFESQLTDDPTTPDILQTILKEIKAVAAAFDDLKAQVTDTEAKMDAATAKMDAAVSLLHDLFSKLTNAASAGGASDADLTALATDLKAKTDALDAKTGALDTELANDASGSLGGATEAPAPTDQSPGSPAAPPAAPAFPFVSSNP